jgi:hypothetical protein
MRFDRFENGSSKKGTYGVRKWAVLEIRFSESHPESSDSIERNQTNGLKGGRGRFDNTPASWHSARDTGPIPNGSPMILHAGLKDGSDNE